MNNYPLYGNLNRLFYEVKWIFVQIIATQQHVHLLIATQQHVHLLIATQQHVHLLIATQQHVHLLIATQQHVHLLIATQQHVHLHHYCSFIWSKREFCHFQIIQGVIIQIINCEIIITCWPQRCWVKLVQNYIINSFSAMFSSRRMLYVCSAPFSDRVVMLYVCSAPFSDRVVDW